MQKQLPVRLWRHGSVFTCKILILLLSTFTLTAFAANPSPPGALRYQVYSATAAELFWDRATDDGIVIGYEVQLNGSILESRDATSYYTDSLTPGQAYSVSVTAIDDEGNRSAASSVSFIGGDRSSPTDPEPVEPEPTEPEPTASTVAAPTGLTASVYSQKSAELFWDRPDTFGLTYEVTRNGSVLTITDGVSYYDNQLVGATEYRYEVTAIDLQGERSAASEITVQTTSGGGGTPPEPEEPPAGLVAAPTGLAASVYSQKSAELFWDRPATFGLSYEVSRDGAVLVTTDGVSFFDNQLSGGTAYIYQVTAVDLLGNRSEPAGIILNTPGTDDDDSPGPVIPPVSNDANIAEPVDLFIRDGYSPVNVIRLDLRTVIEPGPCNAEDESGCTLADVMADIDKFDDHTVDINVHLTSDDFANDGLVSNAELRLRGGGSRFAPQKSFRIKLDSKQDLWRGERHLQLNKHPFDSRRIRNKIAMDIMSEIPNLPSLRTQFVNLWIDDGEGPVDYGLFTHVERVNEYFLRKREWNEDSNIYKAEYFRFARTDLPSLQIDEDGEPIDEDLFERTLEIENGEDHRTLVAMMTALHDPDRSYQSVLDQYFDRDNVMAWIATNIMLRQYDSVRHNFILYNPADTEKFYFIPWDYDATMKPWREAPNDLSNNSLRQRLEYGYAVAAGNPFLEKFYRQPGIHSEILQAIENIRQNYVTDEWMAEQVNHFITLIEPFQQREPDSVHNPEFSVFSVGKIIDVPAQNEEAVRSRFGLLMAPILAEPELQASQWIFSWSTAYDVTSAAGSASYRLQVASTPTFETNSMVIDIDAIESTSDPVVHSVDAALLSSGEYFARLIATPANEPERYWQVSGNKLYYNEQVYYGVLHFEVP